VNSEIGKKIGYSLGIVSSTEKILSYRSDWRFGADTQILRSFSNRCGVLLRSSTSPPYCYFREEIAQFM